MNHYITDPPCAFTEAVVAGYSPIDKHVCHFARIAAKMRSEPWWLRADTAAEPGYRGDVWLGQQHPKYGYLVGWRHGDTLSGEIPWR